jgi:uncharacterized protein YegP (UPF0339 family)
VSTYVLTAKRAAGWHWEIVRALADGADVVLVSACAYPDEAACRLATGRIADQLANAEVVQETTGEWRWRCHDDNGTVVAESSPFTDATSCGHHLRSMCMMVGGAVGAPAGGDRSRPTDGGQPPEARAATARSATSPA